MKHALPLLLLLFVACNREPGLTPRDVLTRDQIDGFNQPVLLAEIEALETAATLIHHSVNGSVVTWTTGDQVTLSFQDELLIATRGLGDDLMSADVANSIQMLRGKIESGHYPRFHSYLDGEYQTQYRSFQCKRGTAISETVTIFSRNHATTRIEEHCVSPGLEITNIYWRGTDGFLWKTRQWVSPTVGYVATEQLAR